MTLQLDIEQRLHLEASDFTGACVAVLGIRGSGKSSTTGVLIEELLPHTSISVVDIEGEYWGLKEQHDLLVVGRSPHVDLEITPEQAGDIARFVLANGLSAILDMSDFDPDEMTTCLVSYFTALWDEASRRRIPHQIVLEEAHEFVPQDGRSPLRDLLTRIALRGRKRGLGLVAVSQRSANVSKSVLTQASLLFLHRVTHPADMAVYKSLIPLAGKEVEASVRGLQPGQAVARANGEMQIVQMRPRRTFHGGATPGLESATPTLKTIGAELLAELQKTLAVPAFEPAAAGGDAAPLRAALAALTAERDALLEQVHALKAECDALKKDLAESRRTKTDVPTRSAGSLSLTVSGMGVPPSRAEAETPLRSSRAIKRAAGRQRRKFERLMDDLRGQPRWYRDLLAVLDAHPEGFTRRQLAQRLGLSETTVTKHPPAQLVRWGLIERIKQSRQHEPVYRTLLRQHLTEEYPDLNVEGLIRELLSV